MLRLAGLANFEKGAVECINPELGIDDQAELLPYDKESWEIPRDQIKLGKLICRNRHKSLITIFKIHRKTIRSRCFWCRYESSFGAIRR